MNGAAERVLLLLADGECHVAGFYRAEPKTVPAQKRLDDLLEALEQLEARGLISGQSETGADRAEAFEAYRDWLPSNKDANLTEDPIGLWYDLTDAGRAFLQTQLTPRAREDQWVMLLHDRRFGYVRVVGADEAIATRALRAELDRRHIDASRHLKTDIRPVDRYVMRDGTTITNGVEIVYNYDPVDTPVPGSS
jgi:hypothetical protein